VPDSSYHPVGRARFYISRQTPFLTWVQSHGLELLCNQSPCMGCARQSFSTLSRIFMTVVSFWDNFCSERWKPPLNTISSRCSTWRTKPENLISGRASLQTALETPIHSVWVMNSRKRREGAWLPSIHQQLVDGCLIFVLSYHMWRRQNRVLMGRLSISLVFSRNNGQLLCCLTSSKHPRKRTWAYANTKRIHASSLCRFYLVFLQTKCKDTFPVHFVVIF